MPIHSELFVEKNIVRGLMGNGLMLSFKRPKSREIVWYIIWELVKANTVNNRKSKLTLYYYRLFAIIFNNLYKTLKIGWSFHFYIVPKEPLIFNDSRHIHVICVSRLKKSVLRDLCTYTTLICSNIKRCGDDVSLRGQLQFWWCRGEGFSHHAR